MSYIENPKTKNSGILCAIPQSGICTQGCKDCFFQSGRSYLEPLDKNLPNLPPVEITDGMVIRVNDGNDSNNNIDEVIASSNQYKMKFYNTSIPKLEKFDAPAVLTINPGKITDTDFYKIDNPPKNLMFVRFRTNTWNIDLCRQAVQFYSCYEIPIILTFMAYHDINDIPLLHRNFYLERKRTLNMYFAISSSTWSYVMSEFKFNIWVYSCGKIEGEKGKTSCRHCGNCLREYFATKVRMKNE